MRFTRHLYTTIFSILLTFVAPISARAVEDDDEDYDVKARVVRISLISGEVSLKRNGNTDWERARLNFPLVEGDTVSTDRDSRLEIQVDARNFVRLESSSVLRIATLRDEGVAVSLIEGTASVRLAKFDRDREYFEIDAPKVTLAAEKKGLYRLDVSRDGRVRLTARDGGRARIYSETSGFALRDGRTAELIIEGTDAGDWQFLVADQRDSWDKWVDNRERYLAQRFRYDTQYYDNYIWGAEDLDTYGSWVYANDYGWIWRPHVTVINNYHEWAPYRDGHWVWCPPYGWTWVGYEPWGWAPYHYGRWVYYDNYWAWCPRSLYYRHRSWWRPALVAFHISFGDNICWYPLSYYHRDPRSRYYHRAGRDRLTPLRRDEIAYLRRVNPAQLRAVSSVAARDFGSDSARSRAASDDLARRVVNAEPLRGDLPVRPATVARGETGDRVTTARPARVRPSVDVPERQTGASARTPGVPLDNELRRSRVFQGREPITAGPTENVVPNSPEARPTGAVARPARPARIDSGDDNQRVLDRSNDPSERPARPSRTFPPQDRPALPAANEQAAPTAAPSRPSRVEQPEIERPSRPSGIDRPERIDRPARPDRNDEPARPDRIERPQPRERIEAPPSRPDPPARSEPPQRSEPSHRSEPPQRSEPPPRSEPARHDPPPRNDPAPRNDPPPRSDPAPSRSDPAPSRSDPPPQRSDPPSRSDDAPSRRERP